VTERAFIGLGGNLGDVVRRMQRAVDAIDALPCTRVCRVSALYRNPPMGPPDQPDYINAVAELDTGLAPLELLVRLQDIEREQGRVRGAQRWQARTLDLDLLLYGDRCMDTPRLVLPHPGLHLRPFVVHPLAEVAPDVEIPGLGRALSIAAGLTGAGLHRLAETLVVGG
jgi:2-amino-4-hydroxy-6-hydroxymethyldihydropteridine diphosphokinase